MYNNVYDCDIHLVQNINNINTIEYISQRQIHLSMYACTHMTYMTKNITGHKDYTPSHILCLI